jgi:hypothetical protein
LLQSGLEALHTVWEAIAWKKGGEVVLRSGAETGRIFFVGGKVAWVTASTIKRTFLAHLVDHTPLDHDQLQRVFDSCRKSGGNFGETIVEWGLLEQSVLRELLRQHLVECLYEILCWPGLSSMFVPEARAYKGTLTYEFREVLEGLLRSDQRARLPFSGLTADQVIQRLQEQTGHYRVDQETMDEILPQRGRFSLTVAGFVVGLLLAAGLIFAFWYGGQHRQQARVDASQAAGLASTPRAPVPPAVDAAPVAAEGEAATDGAVTDAAALGDGAAIPGDAAARGDAAHADDAGDASGADGGPAAAPIVVGVAGEGLGSVRLLSRPARARIYLDGVDTGRRTPHRMRRVVAGLEHVVLLDRRGYAPAVRRFKLAPEMEATLRLELQRLSRRERRVRRAPVTVQLTSQPPGARVYVNRRYRRVKTPTEVRLDPRRASRVELRLGGHRPWRRRIRPVEGVPLVYRAELKPTKRRRRRRR